MPIPSIFHPQLMSIPHAINMAVIAVDAQALRTDIANGKISNNLRYEHWLMEFAEAAGMEFSRESCRDIHFDEHTSIVASINVHNARPTWKSKNYTFSNVPRLNILNHLMGYGYMRYALAHTRAEHPQANLYMVSRIGGYMSDNEKLATLAAQKFMTEFLLPHSHVMAHIQKAGIPLESFSADVLSAYNGLWGKDTHDDTPEGIACQAWKNICAAVVNHVHGDTLRLNTNTDIPTIAYQYALLAVQDSIKAVAK